MEQKACSQVTLWKLLERKEAEQAAQLRSIKTSLRSTTMRPMMRLNSLSKKVKFYMSSRRQMDGISVPMHREQKATSLVIL